MLMPCALLRVASLRRQAGNVPEPALAAAQAALRATRLAGSGRGGSEAAKPRDHAIQERVAREEKEGAYAAAKGPAVAQARDAAAAVRGRVLDLQDRLHNARHEFLPDRR